MTIPTLSEADIRSGATDKSFERGLIYHQNDAVCSLVQRGDEVHAEVMAGNGLASQPGATGKRAHWHAVHQSRDSKLSKRIDCCVRRHAGHSNGNVDRSGVSVIMPAKSIYRTLEGEAEIHTIYDRQLARLNLPYESRHVNTRFGATHVLVLGSQSAPPLVVLQGGNTTSPLTLGWLQGLVESYRVFAPDTIGHPGKSAPVRLLPHDDSYGQWLVDVLDALGLQQPPCMGGSYGAGILLRAAVYAPERIGKAVVFIPSGLVSIPFSTMVHMLVWLGLYHLAPTPERLKRILWPMFKEEPIDDQVLEITQAVFRHVRIETDMPRNVRREELAHFKAPTLVIAAERDALFPAEQVVKRAREVFPNLMAAEIIPGATHYLPARYHAYLNERSGRFLKETK